MQKYDHNLKTRDYLTERMKEPQDRPVKIQLFHRLLIDGQNEPLEELFRHDKVLHEGSFEP